MFKLNYTIITDQYIKYKNLCGQVATPLTLYDSMVVLIIDLTETMQVKGFGVKINSAKRMVRSSDNIRKL